MAVLQASGVGDILTTTINKFERMRFADISSALQDHIVMSRLVKEHKVIFDGGPGYTFDLMTDNNGSARTIGLHARDVVDTVDVMIQASIPWRHITWNWAIDNIEIAINSGGAQKIVDLAMTRRKSAQISGVEKLEFLAWHAPALNSADPYGIPYYIVKSATAANYANNDGFNGLVPSGHTTVAGINPTDVPRWRNYSDAFTDISFADLIPKWERMATKIVFKPPVDDMPILGKGDDRSYYTNYELLAGLRVLQRSQNEDVGMDLDFTGGKATFRRVPVEYVPALEPDTTKPVYAVNWSSFFTAGLRDRWLVETVVPVVGGQHNDKQVHTDCSFNWGTWNRRHHGVLSTGTTMPSA